MQITSVEPHNVKDLKFAVSTVTTNWLKKKNCWFLNNHTWQMYKSIKRYTKIRTLNNCTYFLLEMTTQHNST